MARPLEKTITNFLGVNKIDNPNKALPNEFSELQNHVHTNKGLLYKRSGSVADLVAGDITGCNRITGLHRFHDPYGDRHTFYHCAPDAVALTQPTTDLTLAEDSTTGDIFNGAAVSQLRFCYTYVGMGIESNYNSHTRGGFNTISLAAPLSASAQGGHQTITLSANTKSVLVTPPVPPKGVVSINIYMSMDSPNREMTLVGSLLPAQTLLVTQFIGPSTAGLDAVTVSAGNNFTRVNHPDGGPGDPAGALSNGNYYLRFSWVTDPAMTEGMSFINAAFKYSKLSAETLVPINGDFNAIEVKNNSGTSANGATYLYVFMGQSSGADAPLTLMGIIKADNSETLLVRNLISGLNAQSHGGTFYHSTQAGNSQNTNRFGFIVKKTASSGTVTDIANSRSEAFDVFTFLTLNPTTSDNTIKTDTDTFVANKNFGVQNIELRSLDTYKEPTFESTQGVGLFVNGVNSFIKVITPWSMGYLRFDTGSIPLGVPPTPNVITTFDSSVVIGGGECGTGIYFSNAFEMRDWRVGGAGTALRFIILGDPFGNETTVLSRFSYTTGTVGPESFLLIFKKSSIWNIASLPDTSGLSAPNNLSGAVGTESYRSVQHTSIGTAFVANDGNIYLIRGSGEPIRIGTKIKSLLSHLVKDDSLAKQVTAVFHEDFYKVSYPSALTSTNNDRQLYGDFRTSQGNPIVWSGPHLGIEVGPQIVFESEGDDQTRLGAQANAVGSALLDDISTFQDLGSPIVSIIDSLTLRIGRQNTLNRLMSFFMDIFFDVQFNHSILVEIFADQEYTQKNIVLSTGGGAWDVDDWDVGLWSDAQFFPITFLIGDTNLLGRIMRFKITHSDNAQIIFAAAQIEFKPERRKII